MQIWFSCLYDSDLRKIDAQIRSNKSSLGIFSSRRKGGFMEVRKEDQRDQDEKVVEIEIERLRDFKNHPFKVQADSQMKELQESIRKCSQVDYLTGKKSVEVISEECGDSPKQVQRYLKLTKLIPELLEKVDDGTMGFTIAVELASLTEKNQKTVLEAMESTLGTPNLSQAIRIKKLQEDGRFSQEKIEEFLSEIKQKDVDRVVFKNEQLYRYFPSYYTAEQMKREILTLLKINMTFE